MRRREFIALLISTAIGWPLNSEAQQLQPTPPKRVGVLELFGCPLQPDNPVTRRLAELGWIEGRTFIVECESTVGRLNQLPAVARELVSRRPDVVSAASIPLIKALKQATTTIPIVMLSTPEPVRTGIVTAWFGFDILPKRIELLKEIAPNLKRLAIISSVYGDEEGVKITEENLTIAARRLGFEWQIFKALVHNDYNEIFARLVTEHFDAAYITAGPFTTQNGSRIIELALRHRMPAVGEGSLFAKYGLLLSYGQDYLADFARASEYLDKILRGAKPSELPVQQATKLELRINLSTAKTLGLTVPPILRAQATEVIE
jgi:putative ABC transport system substrate-binding protein